mgnify:CR=1 FL=1
MTESDWHHDDRFGLQAPSPPHPSGVDHDMRFMITDIVLTDETFGTHESYSSSLQRSSVFEDVTRYGVCKVILFGVTEDGNTVCCRVRGFYPGVNVLCTKSNSEAVLNQMERLAKDETLRERVEWIRKKRTDGFHPDEVGNHRQFDFLRVRLLSVRAFHAVVRELQVAGARISARKKRPLIQFILQTRLRPNHWCSVKGGTPARGRISHDRIEIECSVATMCSLPDVEAIPPMLLASVDIETQASTSKKPNASNDGDRVFMIGTTFWRLGHRERTVVILTIGPCDPVAGAFVQSFGTEVELLNAWRNLVVVDAPVVGMIGYNTFTYDYPYMQRRADKVGATHFNFMSRIVAQQTKLEDVKLESAAYGKNKLRIFRAPGVFHVDIWLWVKLNKKYSSNTLNNVATIVLGQQKDDLPYATMFEHMDSGDPTKVALVASYNKTDTLLPLDIALKLDILSTMINMSRVTVTGINDLVARGQQFKVLNQIFWFCEQNGFEVMETEATGTKFQGATVVEPIPGLYKKPLAVLDFASLYPTIMMAYNLCMCTRVIREHDAAVVPATSHVIEFTAFKNLEATGVAADSLVPFDGATDPTRCIIYARLVNECYVLHPDDANRQPPKKEWSNEYYVRVASATFWNRERKCNTFASKVTGILPQILRELVAERKRTRERMETATDPTVISNLNGRQLALKVSANSVYGFTGVREGMLPCQEIAETVTRIARESIQLVIDRVKDAYPCDVVYGDTDSVMIRLHEEAAQNIEICFDRGDEIGPWATGFFPSPMKLEMEKVYSRFLILGKKRYVGMMYTRDADGAVQFEKMDAKGVELVRRGFSPFGKRVYSSVLDVVMKEESIDGVKGVIERAMQELVNHAVPIDDLVMSKELGDDYKSTAIVQLRVSQKIAARDEEEETPIIGDRVPYVMIRSDDRLVSERGEDPSYVKRHNLPIDWLYYGEKQVATPVTQLLESVVDLTPLFKPHLEVLKRQAMVRRGKAQGSLEGGGSGVSMSSGSEPCLRAASKSLRKKARQSTLM